MSTEYITEGENMLATAWFIALILFFVMGLNAIHSGDIVGLFFGIASLTLFALCLLGYYWSIRGFRPSRTTLLDGEEIDHGK